MLLKKIITQYGTSVRSDHVDPRSDIIHAALDMMTGDISDLRAFRQNILDALSEAKPFFLDHKAADYVDHISWDMRVKNDYDVSFMRDILIPEDVVWIEIDAKALSLDQKKRLPDFDLSAAEIDELNLRGILFDNRDPDRLIAWVFRMEQNGSLIDPITTEVFPKDRAGFPIINEREVIMTPHVMRYVEVAWEQSGQAPDIKQIVEANSLDFLQLYARSYALFAILGSMQDDITISDTPIFTPKEMKNARKFGKSHIISAPKSHITIDLSDTGSQYMDEVRSEFKEQKARKQGSPKVHHKVREHYRRYKSGKIVKVRAHERGSLPDTRPTRVTVSNPDDGLEPQ
jgi:hypothetical protein